MASTRNINTPEDYCLQQRSYGQSYGYNTYENSFVGRAYHTAIPCLGITPNHMPRDTLSNNPVEIESSLFGIGSANLVQPQAPVKPELKRIPEISFFTTTPVIMPEEFSILNNQRPFPVPNSM